MPAEILSRLGEKRADRCQLRAGPRPRRLRLPQIEYRASHRRHARLARSGLCSRIRLAPRLSQTGVRPCHTLARSLTDHTRGPTRAPGGCLVLVLDHLVPANRRRPRALRRHQPRTGGRWRPAAREQDGRTPRMAHRSRLVGDAPVRRGALSARCWASRRSACLTTVPSDGRRRRGLAG